MIFDKIISRQEIWRKFTESYKNDKIPNAYILFGDDGVGKEALSIELAGLLNCKRPTENLSACGSCRSCIGIKTFQHEDVHFIHPIPKTSSTKKTQLIDSKTAKELDDNYKEKLKNPYHKIEISNANTIPIDLIRSIKKKLFLSKSDENWSVVVIFNAEKLCVPKAEPANALLKILEEPPSQTLFVLITSKINLMLPTIQSRCQKVFFPNLKIEEIEKYAQEYDTSLPLDSSYLQMSNGSMSRFIKIAKNDVIDKIQLLIKNFYTNNVNDFEKTLSFFSKVKSKNKSEMQFYLDYLITITKDIYLLSLDKENSATHYPFLSNTYSQILTNFPSGDWIRIIGLINQCIQDINRNVNLSLSIYNMLINVQHCLEGNSIDRFKSNLIQEL